MRKFYDCVFSKFRSVVSGLIGSLLLIAGLTMTSGTASGQGVGINTTGSQADTSAGLDVDFSNKGILIPRMTLAQRNAIYHPANGLLIYNTDCNTFNYNAGTPSAPNWQALLSSNSLPAPGAIAGLVSVCANQQGVSYTIPAVVGATSYTWTVPSGAVIVSGQGTTAVNVDFGTSPGNICVTAGNFCSTSSPSCVAVAFNASPAITLHPSNAAVCDGSNTSFNVTASGSGLTYQWQEFITSWNDLINGGIFSNVTTANLAISGTFTGMNGRQYRCVVGGSCQPSPVISNPATLTINTAPSITLQPANAGICPGNATGFSVTATGAGLAYQWQEFISSWNNLSNTAPYSNVTTSAMSISSAGLSMNNYQYRCVVSDTCTPSPATSNAAILTVYLVPSSAFTCSPANPAILQPAVFTPTVSGATYSWTFQSGSPATSTAQNPSVTWSVTGTYDVTLTVTQNGCISAITTNPVTVISCPHGSQTFTYNGSTQTWTVPNCVSSITVDALGAGGGITPGSGATAGSGGRITATITVTPGQQLIVVAGGAGQDGLYNRSGSGGGGFSGVLDISNNHLVSAGGGGGSAGNESCPSVGSGGNGGGSAGTNGSCGSGGAAGITNATPTGGAGGTASVAGSPGTSTGGGNGGATSGDSGTGGGGGGYGTGAGASMYGSCGGYSGAGGFGGGGSGGTGGCGGTQERLSGGGGGGGGFNGGSGGNVTPGCGSCGGGGGGGGRNYALPGATITTNSVGGGAAAQSSGSVTITW